MITNWYLVGNGVIYIYIYIFGSQTTTDQRLCISLFSVSLYLSHYTASATPLLFSPPSLTALHQPCLRHSSSRSPTAGASIASSLSLCAVRILTQNLVRFSNVRERRHWKLYWYMHHCSYFGSCRWPCSRRDGWRPILHVPYIHPNGF
ncbi:uncharacterized protein LOC114322234 [Camellia sinensis]|uniref:uncharacterized protein LOC114322234 n=1 Tax=Camellia sinensis TaxID=4442 RepID=UPI00103576B2|nr:uncharacterized protein LOC114322234 [Camellia sinensis]